MESYENAREQMKQLYNEGIRILFFCGGETFLWSDSGKSVKDLVVEAKEIGFYLVNVVTNGTFSLDIPEADVIFLSLDGLEKNHNDIRGETFQKIMQNVDNADNANICVYMAVNNRNHKDVTPLTELVRDTKNLNSISFNFHTPYEGTEHLSLSSSQKEALASEITGLIDKKYPVFNLKSGLRHYIKGSWKGPSKQCLVLENGKRYECGRCVEIPGLCDECGYLFAVEFSLLFRGNIPAIWDMLKTYRRFA